MLSARKTLAGAALALALASAGGASSVPAAQAPYCAEDAKCWTWSTMGNKQRAIVTRDGRRIVVGPCAYRALAGAGWIAASTPKLRGDYTATQRKCS